MSTRTSLPMGHVHIWKFELDVTPEYLVTLQALLSADERARADQYLIPGVRERFIAGRATVRLILSMYLGTAPEAIEISCGEFGKPELRDTELQFNFSNSYSLGVLAIAYAHEVGVDIEKIRHVESADAIARVHFAPVERESYFAADSKGRIEGFFRTMTRKEALLKACGKGLSVPLNEVQVGLNREHSDLSFDLEPALKLYDFSPAPGYVGALAGENLTQVESRDWFHKSR